MVPVTAPSVTLTAVATTESGGTATHAVTVTVADLGENALALRAHPGTGGVPLTTSFSLIGGPVPARIELDFDGDGQMDFVGPTLDGQTFTYQRAGLFYPWLRVVDDQGAAFTATGLVQVLDPAALETLLQARWSGLRDALSRADVPAAVALFAGASRDAYRDQLTSLAGVGRCPGGGRSRRHHAGQGARPGGRVRAEGGPAGHSLLLPRSLRHRHGRCMATTRVLIAAIVLTVLVGAGRSAAQDDDTPLRPSAGPYRGVVVDDKTGQPSVGRGDHPVAAPRRPDPGPAASFRSARGLHERARRVRPRRGTEWSGATPPRAGCCRWRRG